MGKGTQIENIKKWLETHHGPTHVLKYSNIKGDLLTEEYEKEYYMDGIGPRKLTKNEKIKAASVRLYKEMFDLMTTASEGKMNLILDRAHLGETVYSPIYRNYEGDFVWIMEHTYCSTLNTGAIRINKVELCMYDTWFDTKLIVFTDDAENLINREDGLSFSIKKSEKEKEIDAFHEAFHKSCLNKKLIKITGLNAEQVWSQEVQPFLEAENILTDYYKEYFE